jgi:hypothetical protein
MKLTEITNTARKTINKMNSLYIEYSIHGKVDTFHKLWNMIEANTKSDDQDVSSQTLLYKNKLTSDLIRTLKK